MFSVPALEAREALMHLEDLGCDPTWETIDYELCVIRGMRRRLRGAERLMPSSAWPDLATLVREAPGLIVAVTPCVDLAPRERRALLRHARAARRDLLEGGLDPFSLLALEGLIEFLAGRDSIKRLGGHELAELVRETLRSGPRATGVAMLCADLGS